MGRRQTSPEPFDREFSLSLKTSTPDADASTPCLAPCDEGSTDTFTSEEPGHAEAQRVRQFQSYLRFRQSRVPPPDDVALVAAQFINEHHPFIVSICKKYPRAGMEPEDRAQEVWNKLCARIVDFDYNEQYPSIRGWIGGFVRRELAGWPKGPREPVLEACGSDLLLAHCLSLAPSPSETLEMRCKRQVVDDVLARLPDSLPRTSYEVFELRLFGNLTYAEIGDALHLTQPQARKCFHLAKGQFRLMVELHPEYQSD